MQLSDAVQLLLPVLRRLPLLEHEGAHAPSYPGVQSFVVSLRARAEIAHPSFLVFLELIHQALDARTALRPEYLPDSILEPLDGFLMGCEPDVAILRP